MTDKSSSKTKKSPPLSLRTRFFLCAISAVADRIRRRDGTVNRRLLSLLDPRVPACRRPCHGVRAADVTIDPARKLWFRLFVPVTATSDSKLPVIVFFHGGGFAFLSAASLPYTAVCRRLARKLSAVVVSVNYRLAPEHKFPAPYVDCLDALRYLDRTASIPSLGFDSVADLSNCFLMGDSAGGNIAHHVARKYAADTEDWARVRLSGSVIIQPYFGGEEQTESEVGLKKAPLVNVERTDWLWKAFLPAGADRDHEAANVFGPRDGGEGLGEGFPAAMVVVGGWDPLQEWQRRYAEGLRRRGKEVRVAEYENAMHAFYVFPEVKESGVLIEEIKGFIATHKKKSDQRVIN